MKKIKFYLVYFFKHEQWVGTVQIILFLVTIITAYEWIICANQKLEPYTIVFASVGGIFDVIKRIIREPKLPRLTFAEFRPQTSRESAFFIGSTLTDLNEGLKIAKQISKGLFLVIYDPEHSTQSQLNYALGYFTQYERTKRLINQYFVQVIIPSDKIEVQAFIPKNYHMETCLLVVLDKNGTIIRQEPVYANAEEGLKRVNSDISKL